MTTPIYSFSPDAWERGKLEAICAIVRAGKNDKLITYTELSNSITSMRIEPHDFAMIRLLDEISKEENALAAAFLQRW